jgi:hypothetical protein
MFAEQPDWFGFVNQPYDAGTATSRSSTGLRCTP